MAAKDATQTRTKMSMYCLSECVILSVQIWEIFSETPPPRHSKHEMFLIIQSRYRYIYVYVLKTEVKKKYDIFIFIGISRN